MTACGERTNLEFADVTATRAARVTSARLVDASPGFRAVDVLGYNGPNQTMKSTRTVGSADSTGYVIVGPIPSDAAVRLPTGIPISRDAKRPTVLVVTVTSSCAPSVAAGKSQAHLVASKVEVTVEAGGKARTQTLTGDIDICVSKAAPEHCP